MGQNQSYQNNTQISPEPLEKTVFPQELAAELETFESNRPDCTGYKFIVETSSNTSCKYNFYRYDIFISDTKNVFKKNGIYIKVFSGYRGIDGTDYNPLNADEALSANNLISKWTNGYVSVSGIYNIDCINYKFIDMVKDYQPVLYKLLVWLKTGK